VQTDERDEFESVSAQLDALDYYALLGLSSAATTEEIRAAFHRFALLFHPDRYVDEPGRQGVALRVFKRGSEAYRVLSSTVLRARFDKARSGGALRLSIDEMFAGEDASTGAVAEVPLPPIAQALYDKAVQSFERGDLAGARMHLMLARAKASGAQLDALEARLAQASERKR
jgi:curved DNA-binding protein CbpA